MPKRVGWGGLSVGGVCFKHVCMCLFSHRRSCYSEGQTDTRGFDYWPERESRRVLNGPDKHRSRTKWEAWLRIDICWTPCLSVEGTGPLLDHFPCIDQNRRLEWNTGARLNVILMCVCLWQAGWCGAWGNLIRPDLCPRVRPGPSHQSCVLDAAVTSRGTNSLRDLERLEDKLINRERLFPVTLQMLSRAQSSLWQKGRMVLVQSSP